MTTETPTEPAMSAMPPMTTETPTEPAMSAMPPMTTETPTSNELPNDISKSLNDVVDYVSSKIADKIKNDINLSNNNSETSNMQNGFNAVNEATEQMTKGGKKRKKFRLTKKRKNN